MYTHTHTYIYIYITGKSLVLLLIFPFLASNKGARIETPRPQDGNSEKLQLIVLLPDGRCLVTTAKSGNFPPLATIISLW